MELLRLFFSIMVSFFACLAFFVQVEMITLKKLHPATEVIIIAVLTGLIYSLLTLMS
jgi:uncharacterized membrane protein (DUF106 family)